MGISALRRVQVGRESPAGTAVAATSKQLGKATMEGMPVLHRPEDENGSLANNGRTVVAGNAVELTFEGDATYEQLMYWLENGIETIAAAGPADEAYTYAYDPNLTSANTLKTFTIEYGDDVQAHEVEYCITKALEISGAMDGPWTVKAAIFGRNQTPTSFTGALTDPTVETILANLTTLAIDNSGGTMGYTVKSSTLISFAWKLETGFKPTKHGGATLYFDKPIQSKIKLVVDMKLVFNAGMEAERLLFEAGTRRLFRLLATGSIIGGGTTPREAELSFAGVYTKFSSLGENEGEDVVDITIEGEYDPTWAKLFTVEVVNEVATIA